ncbi:MAG: helix-turn-helix domain-containing protein [Nanoarchaeota archaeon]|nr:helix-turn-helix domain-containing protein [Nanoarchaeota archaeon]
MDTSILEDLGLTGAEIKVFLALLELGSTNAGSVVEKSGLQNAVVHRAFHSLAEKGLVSSILEGKIRRYSAANPSHLLEFVDEKKSRLQTLLPELELKRKMAKTAPQATLFQGVRGTKELLYSLLETGGKEYASYGGPIQSNEALGEYFWESFHNRRIKKGVTAKLLFHTSLNSWGVQLSKKKKTQVRLTSQALEGLTETIICGNRVGIVLWMEKPYGFLMEDKAVADSYRKFFDVLWNSAPETRSLKEEKW